MISLSHPTWMRGLKLVAFAPVKIEDKVASYMDAWIKTEITNGLRDKGYASHPTWMRGLKRYITISDCNPHHCRILHGCVD